MASALINVPPTAARGATVEIKALVSHVMETGYRHDTEGKPIPRSIVRTFNCTYNGQPVFSVDLSPAIAANPFFAFTMRASESGTLLFSWTDDDGRTETRTASLLVG